MRRVLTALIIAMLTVVAVLGWVHEFDVDRAVRPVGSAWMLWVSPT